MKLFWKKDACRFDPESFRKNGAVTIDADTLQPPWNWDALFDRLEQALASNLYIIVDNSLHDINRFLVVARFLERYKIFVDYCYADALEYGGHLYIKLKQTWTRKDKSGYAALVDAYSKNYYMEDCGGFISFRKSNGQEMDERLQKILTLVNPQPGEKILDVGSGRGELSYAMARLGADVTGVDYSAAAVEIAQDTYGKNTPPRIHCGLSIRTSS